MAKTDAVWTELDPSSLSAELAKAYADYKDAYKFMKEQRTAWEAAFEAESNPPQGKRVVFGYNFGKLTVSMVDDDRKPAKATPAKLSLNDWIAAQQASGART